MKTANKIIAAAAIAAAMGCGIVSCGNEKKEDAHAEASGLYQRTCKLTRQYIDSIRSAKDTTELNQLLERYEAMLDRLNFEVPADTDYNLTEGENDTISQLMLQLSRARIERLKALGASLPADTIPAADTLPFSSSAK